MWLPPKVSAESARAEAQHRAELLSMLMLREELNEYNRELKQIDPYLELVWAPENVTAPGLVPGRFHVLRHNPGTAPSVYPLQGSDGEFRQPGSWIYDELRKRDLWNDSAQRERKRAEEELERQYRRRLDQERQERIDEINERAKAYFNPGVSMTGRGKGWSYRAGAKKKAA